MNRIVDGFGIHCWFPVSRTINFHFPKKCFPSVCGAVPLGNVFFFSSGKCPFTNLMQSKINWICINFNIIHIIKWYNANEIDTIHQLARYQFHAIIPYIPCIINYYLSIKHYAYHLIQSGYNRNIYGWWMWRMGRKCDCDII